MSDYMSGRGRVGDGFRDPYKEEMRRRNPLFDLFQGGGGDRPEPNRPEAAPEEEGLLGYVREPSNSPGGYTDYRPDPNAQREMPEREQAMQSFRFMQDLSKIVNNPAEGVMIVNGIEGRVKDELDMMFDGELARGFQAMVGEDMSEEEQQAIAAIEGRESGEMDKRQAREILQNSVMGFVQEFAEQYKRPEE
ncbi:DNA polymerase [Rhodobacteraceae phage LS06-2018-MD07]|jgi:hypothetical protein|nr:DNA polymerase [Rhodobacteraceae phage LS06-2018-MD07]